MILEHPGKLVRNTSAQRSSELFPHIQTHSKFKPKEYLGGVIDSVNPKFAQFDNKNE